MKIYTVYKVTNRVNGKVYIGYTSLKPETRFNQHRQYAFTTNRKGKLLYKAVEKYGPDAFDFEVLYQSLDMDHALSMEAHFIIEFKAFVDLPGAHGYNLTSGGRQAVKSSESIEAQRAKMLGRKQTPEHVAKKGFSSTRNPNFKGMPANRVIGEEERRNASERMKALYASGYVHPSKGMKQTEFNKQRTRDANKKTYHLDHNGTKYVTDDLPVLAAEHGFNKDSIRNYSRRGDRLKGWIIEYTVSAKGEKYVYGS